MNATHQQYKRLSHSKYVFYAYTYVSSCTVLQSKTQVVTAYLQDVFRQLSDRCTHHHSQRPEFQPVKK